MWELNGGLFLLPCNVKPKPTEKLVQAHEKTAEIIVGLVRSPLVLPLLGATVGLGESLFLLIFLLGIDCPYGFVSIVTPSVPK